ncbi:MAG: exosortase family protein XrtF [Flavobacteriaceae bacterium]|nr:exosortase family protein XrtF [Flavobacteriaceae bacterium]
MKAVINQHKLFFVFLFKFLVFYIIFASAYKVYLNQYDVSKFEIDFISENVAHQTVSVLIFFGVNAQTFHHEFEPSMKIIYKEKYAARIVEGCNAISVIILFASFVFAFSNGFKRTLSFIFFGTLLIYGLNIVRIALLTYFLYYYPQYETLLHGTIFPLFIYGVVFILWVLWVTRFSGFNQQNVKK